MANLQSDPDKVITDVLIEMERMFADLGSHYPRELKDQYLLVRDIEAAFRDTLKTMHPSAA